MSDFNTAKYLNKQMKSRGLQKLKYYCQVCRKQCRDDNGFRSHIKSSSHLKKINNVTQEDIDKFSKLFESSFLSLLKLSHGEKWIEANRFYNKFIQDKNHIHMNSTCFKSLSQFIKYLGKNGKIRVRLDEEENDRFENNNNNDIDMGQLQISYVDRSKENILRQQRINEIENNTKDEQEIRSMLLKKQIEKIKRKEKGKEQAEGDNQTNNVTTVTNNNNEIILDNNIQMSLSIRPTNAKKVSKPNQRKHKAAKNVFD
ncbi:Rts2p PWA37_001110 [Arxiozyma heterogenica]|uniref:Rts2p n=1 Tax=Arxiozyma heterogenica TaxID=278026 RepID=UPI002F1FB3D1